MEGNPKMKALGEAMKRQVLCVSTCVALALVPSLPHLPLSHNETALSPTAQERLQLLTNKLHTYNCNKCWFTLKDDQLMVRC